MFRSGKTTEFIAIYTVIVISSANINMCSFGIVSLGTLRVTTTYEKTDVNYIFVGDGSWSNRCWQEHCVQVVSELCCEAGSRTCIC